MSTTRPVDDGMGKISSVPSPSLHTMIESLERRILLSDLSFVAYAPGAAGGAPDSITAADLNGDGSQDLVTANSNGTVSILLGNGDGKFEPPQTFPDGLPNGPTCLAIADLNGDGRLDLVVGATPQAVSVPARIAVLLGNGDGTFQSPVTYPVSAGQVDAIAIADFNGDGVLDIATANGTDGTVSIFLGNGGGSFQSAKTLILPGTPGNAGGDADATDLAVGEFNGDHQMDLAVVNANDPQGVSVSAAAGRDEIDIFQGNGNGTFQSPQELSLAGNYVQSIVAADVNNDGYPDLVVGDDHGSVIVLLGNSDGTFQPPSNIFQVGDKTRVDVQGVADMNNDGKPDIVITVGDGSDSYQAQVLIGNGDGTFQLPTTGLTVYKYNSRSAGSPLNNSGYASTSYAHALAIADFNGDERIDLAVAMGTSVYALVNSSDIPGIMNDYSFVRIEGTYANDTASLSYSSGELDVQIDGFSSELKVSEFTVIDITLYAGNDSLTISGDVPPVMANGMDGSDTIVAGNSAKDELSGGNGADSIVGGSGNDYLGGDSGKDTLVAGSGRDTLSGDAGNDSITGGSGADLLLGGAGSDTLVAGSGNTTLRGASGADSVDGSGGGDDLLAGGGGPDTLIGAIGDSGTDTLKGGGGINMLTPGSRDSVVAQ